MSEALKNLMANIGQLSTKEKAWTILAEQRSEELESGKVEPLTWAQIKQKL